MPHHVDIHVGHRLREFRERAGMPQKKLAKQLGISFQQVQKYESGANRISASKLHEVCAVFHVQPNDFFADMPTKGSPQNGGDSFGHHNARQIIDLNQAFRAISDVRCRIYLVKLAKAMAEALA